MAITAGTLLGAAGIGTVGSLLGGLLSSRSQKSANEANIQMQRETNEMNERLFNQNLAWQEDMWNKTNAYNDPSHQVELLQKAGINPAAVYGNGSMPEASMPSSPAAPTMGAAQVNPVDYSWMSNVVDQGVNAYLNNQILNNQVVKGSYDAQIAKVDAEYAVKTLQDRCIKVLNDSQASEYQKEQAKIVMQVMEGTRDQQILQSEQTTRIQEQQYQEILNRIAESKLHQESMRIANEYAPRLSDAQLKQYSAAVSEL